MIHLEGFYFLQPYRTCGKGRVFIWIYWVFFWLGRNHPHFAVRTRLGIEKLLTMRRRYIANLFLKNPSTEPSTVGLSQKINPCKSRTYKGLKIAFAVWTGLEPATPCVTGRYSNQLNYQTVFSAISDYRNSDIRKTCAP